MHYPPDIYAWNGFIVSLMAIGLSTVAGYRFGALRHPETSQMQRLIISNILASVSIMVVYTYLLFTQRHTIPGFVFLILFALLAFVVALHFPTKLTSD
jgi:hypothetical protein